MNTQPLRLAAIFLLTCHCTPAAVLYVNVNSATPVPPYASWATAASDIQDAIDVSTDGDTILVTNGVYQIGGEVVYGALTNLVAINKAVTVQSVNGPAVTIIQGFQDPDSVVADDAIRCVYMTNNAVLSGFTLTNGATRAAGDPILEQSGGGAWCEGTNAILTNCIIAGNAANNAGGGVYSGTLLNCTLFTNTAFSFGGGAAQSVLAGCALTGNAVPGSYFSNAGGGAIDCTLADCSLTNNFSGTGGGAESSLLTNCILAFNGALGNGGGADSSTLVQCTLTGNQVGVFSPPSPEARTWSGPVPLFLEPDAGGGAENSLLTNCTLIGNQAVGYSVGGGVDSCTLQNCLLMSNNADDFGGGANNSTLNNCVLTNNTSINNGYGNGGGAQYGTLNQCVLAGNYADGDGGGALGSALNDCLVIGNSSGDAGGGAAFATLVNCTVAGNSSPSAAGVTGCQAYDSIVYYNGTTNYDDQTALIYCCATPDPGGYGNITNAPLFVNLAGGDYYLQSNSPCINSGDNSFVATATDLDGNPRIVGGTVDMGAYEYQTPASILSYAWAQQYGLATDGSADYLDLDGTGMPNWEKSIAGLNPTNRDSVLAMLPPAAINNATNGVTLSWDSVDTRIYYLLRATNLAAQAAFSAVQSNLLGQAGTTSCTDTTATNRGPYFYRIGVQ